MKLLTSSKVLMGISFEMFTGSFSLGGIVISSDILSFSRSKPLGNSIWKIKNS